MSGNATSRLNKILGDYVERERKTTARNQLRQRANEQFIRACSSRFKTVVAPALDEIQAVLRAHGHDMRFDASIESSDDAVSIVVNLAGPPGGSWDLLDLASPHVLLVCSTRTRRIRITTSDLMKISRTPRSESEIRLFQLTEELVKDVVVNVLDQIFG